MNTKALKDQIIKFLKQKGNYEPDIDNYNIDKLISSETELKKVLQILEEEGSVIYYFTTNGSRLSKLNPALNAKQMYENSINQQCIRLGISRADRLKLKILEQKEAESEEGKTINSFNSLYNK